MRFGSLFAGIGGLDLGLERAGMTCAWQVEINEYAKKVLALHWPNVVRHDDVRTFPVEPVGQWKVDLICGGFPCQDISRIGKHAGIDGARSGLWSEFARIVRTLRPRYVLVENVPPILGKGIDRILGDLAKCGYDAEWGCLSAASVGAPHLRNRVFVIAYAISKGLAKREGQRINTPEKQSATERGGGAADESGPQEAVVFGGRSSVEQSSWWLSEPDVGRVANGVSSRVDRIKCLGNAVVPQVAEWIGRQIMKLQ